MPIGYAEKYDRVTIAFHWTVAILVIGLWTAGQTIDYLPKGPFRSALWQTHVVFGFTLVIILLGRIIWRLTAGRHLPEVGTPALRRIAKIVHLALYGLLILVLALGIANAFNRGVDIYGLVKLPQIGDKELKHALTDYHGLAANILLALAVFHASAAIWHHVKLKDTVLLRMMPRRA